MDPIFTDVVSRYILHSRARRWYGRDIGSVIGTFSTQFALTSMQICLTGLINTACDYCMQFDNRKSHRCFNDAIDMKQVIDIPMYVFHWIFEETVGDLLNMVTISWERDDILHHLQFRIITDLDTYILSIN